MLLLPQFTKGCPPGSWARPRGSWHNALWDLSGLSSSRRCHCCGAGRVPLIQPRAGAGSAQEHRHTGEQEAVTLQGRGAHASRLALWHNRQSAGAGLPHSLCAPHLAHTPSPACVLYAGDGSWERPCHSPCGPAQGNGHCMHSQGVPVVDPRSLHRWQLHLHHHPTSSRLRLEHCRGRQLDACRGRDIRQGVGNSDSGG